MGNNLPSLIFNSIQQGNILPVTSRCNLSCIFCSHRQNPSGIEVYPLPHRKPREIRESFKYLSRNEKIIIGESATKIIEGEPFCYHGIKETLQDLRTDFPETPFQITTNGTLLDEDTISLIKKLEPLELVVSLNTLDTDKRKEYLGDKFPQKIQDNIKRMGQAGIKFHGSVVALPHLWGWEDLKLTLKFLKENGAMTLRLFLPGFTRLAPSPLIFDLSLWEELRLFVQELSSRLETPLLLEPPFLSDFKARIEGIIKNSPAQKAGLQKGDTILKVNHKRVRSRIGAFDLTQGEKDPFLEVCRGESKEQVRIIKKEKEAPGFVLYRDMDFLRAQELIQTLKRYETLEVLVLTSVLGFPLIKHLAETVSSKRKNLAVKAVNNNFFGGSIMSAGLLVTGDFIDVMESLENQYDLVIIPEEPFDIKGKDLLGNSFLEIQEKAGLPVVMT